MSWFRPKTLLDKTYELGIILKGIDGIFELVSGLLVLFLSPATINHITRVLTQNTLHHNPHSFIATHIAKFGDHLASGHHLFAAIFLLSHGLVKIVVVVCLLLNKMWAYPWSLVIFSLFLVYQLYVMVTSPTIGMAYLTVLDAIIIYLVNREWQQQKLLAETKTSSQIK